MTKEPGKMGTEKPLARVEGNQFDGFDVVSGQCGSQIVIQSNWVFRKGADEYAERINSAALSWAGEREQKLVEVLKCLYEETADYIRINSLGDVHHNKSMKNARDVLESHRPPSDGAGK